jgi:serine protease
MGTVLPKAVSCRAAVVAVLFWVAVPAAAVAGPSSEVIVGFKPGAEVLRSHPWAGHGPAPQAQQVLQQRADRLGQRLGRSLRAGPAVGRGVQVLRAEGVDARTLARQLATHPDVAYVQPNGRKRIVAAPADPLYPASAEERRSNGSSVQNGPASGQWYLRAPDAGARSAIDIEAAWARTRGSAAVVVAVLDTGVRFDHPDLGRVASGGTLLPGYDFVSDAAVANDGNGRDDDATDPGDWTTAAENSAIRGPYYRCDPNQTGAAVDTPSSWHGTATSSLVGAATDNGLGMAGAAPGVRVLPVRVLGKCFGTDNDIISGMRWAAGLPVDGVPDNPNPAQVLNLSLGGSGACGSAYQAAVDEITARGVLVVAAAGNSVGGAVNEPANCRGVLGVVALRHVGSKVGFSDMGPEIGIAAPGGNCINVRPGTPCLYPILAASNSGRRGPVASIWTDSEDFTVGTSFASPLVAAVAGLMVSQRPGIAPSELTAAIKATARPFPTSGADNGPDDPTPVPMCTNIGAAGPSGQCYCTTGLCGAGMLDAGAAVGAAAGALARIQLQTAVPTAGAPLTLDGSSSLGSIGSTVTAWAWRLVSSDAGVASAFTSASNASMVTLTPRMAGRFTVELRVTDSRGASHATQTTITVAAAVSAPPAEPAPAPGGGAGAVTAGWMGGLLLAVGMLLWDRRRG